MRFQFLTCKVLQKEAYFHKVPCLTLRNETEWVELVETGVNVVAGTEPKKIVKCALEMISKKIVFQKNIYGDGSSSKDIAMILRKYLEKE